MNDQAHPLDTEQQEHAKLRAEKRLTIGGSDAAVLLLESLGERPPYGRNSFEIYQRLRGKEDERPDNDRFEVGRLMEPVISLRFTRKTGLILQSLPDQVVHPKYPWYTGHLDRIVVNEPGDAELKTVEWDKDHEWSNPQQGDPARVPPLYLAQAIWYVGLPRPQLDGSTLGAFDRPFWIVAQFGFRELRYYRFDPTPEIRAIHARMFEACQRFYEENVLKGVPPPMPKDGWAAHNYAKALYPQEKEDVLQAEETYVDIAHRFKRLQKLEALVKNRKMLYQAKIEARIGKAYAIEAKSKRGSMRATWSTTASQSGVDWEEVVRRLDVPVPAKIIADCTKTVKESFRTLRVTAREPKADKENE